MSEINFTDTTLMLGYYTSKKRMSIANGNPRNALRMLTIMFGQAEITL